MSGGLKSRQIELLTADQSGGYSLFQPLADALGLKFGRSKRVALMIDRTPIDLVLEIDSGVVVAVTVLAGFESRDDDAPGRPELIVRRETFLDRNDKEAGVVREVQLGIPGFDAHVFIDSDASDEEVRRVLASDTSRAVLTELVSLGADVTLTPASGRARLPRGAFEQAPLERVIEGLLALARVGGPRGAVRPRRGVRLTTAVGWLNVPALGLLLLAGVVWPMSFALGLGLFAAAFAILGVLALSPARALVSGDSGSGRRSRTLTLFVASLGASLATAGLITSNAWFGSAVEVVEHGTISKIHGYDSEDEEWSVEVRWSDGRAERFSLGGAPVAGGRISRTSWEGLFAPWGAKLRVEQQ